MHEKPPEHAKEHPPKTVIGWSEYVTFPDWEIPRLPAKVDTGARTSSLHVENLQLESALARLEDGRAVDLTIRIEQPPSDS